MNGLTLSRVESLHEIWPTYRRMRTQHPDMPARTIHAYLRAETGESFAEFCCPGHEWQYTGTAYGGDDGRWMGEGRCYCIHCGADGDA
jgi:glutamate synthase domain-containing protein 3